VGDFVFEFKESYRRLSNEVRERTYDAVVWCRDTYLHVPAVRATLDSFLVLIGIMLVDRLLHHPIGLRMIYILPIWIAARRGGRIAGYVNVAATCAALTYIDVNAKVVPANSLLINTGLRLAVMVGLMAFIEHFESSLRKYANMAKKDALTGALNRLGLDEYMGRAIDKALGSGGSLTIAMIDCDRFKELNDNHGHEYGDHILKTLARLLRRYAQGGVVARNGGDEFILVLPGKSPADARAILNKVNWKFREATVLGDKCASFTYGISRVGVDGTNTRDVMAAADKDMYLHKATRTTLAVVDLNANVRHTA
jgi:diguanylate cyclase (GGDEF)-like protein